MTTPIADRPLRAVQIGLGSFGRGWVSVVESVAGVELVGAVDPDPNSRDWFRESRSIPVFASYEEARDAVEHDAVLVITPPATHHQLSLIALAAGKHVLVEKPLATTLAEAREVIEAARDAARILQASQNYRYRAPLRTAQRIISQGELGDLVAVKASFRRNTRDLFGDANFRYAMEHPLVLDMAIHHFDLVRALTGRNAISVDARGWAAPGTPYRHQPAVAALIDLEGGVPFTYEGDWAPSFGDADTSWNADWLVKGTQGWLRWIGDIDDALSGTITFESATGDIRTIPVQPIDATDRAGSLTAFRDAVFSGAEPETSAIDNINSLAIVLGCIESLMKREPVKIAG